MLPIREASFDTNDGIDRLASEAHHQLDHEVLVDFEQLGFDYVSVEKLVVHVFGLRRNPLQRYDYLQNPNRNLD